jgi:DNA mismatch repair protein MutS
MLDQYRRLKAEHPGTILFFRMGDFYETFGEDALIASRVLGITLTSRDKKKEGSLPLAGVPHHAVDGYLRTLVNEGHSVAIADQMEPAAEARGLVDRQIVEVLTPGTITRNGILNAVESNYIVALYPDQDRVGVSVAEVSTGEFRVGEISRDEVAALFLEYPAHELLLPTGMVWDGSPWGAAARTTRWDAARFDARAGRQSLERRFGVLSLQSYGLGDPGLGFGAAGALLDYLRSLKKSDLPQIGNVQPLREGAPLVVDEVTLRNLEVLESQAGPEHTLLRLLDRTETAMGGRALRALLRAPSRDRAILESRLERTAAFAESPRLRADARERLHRMPDLERALGLLGSGRASPRDLGLLREGLLRIPDVAKVLRTHAGAVTREWLESIPDLTALASELGKALADELPMTSTQGGIIREGYDKALDSLRRDAQDARSLVLELETRERARTGIQNLKVGFNRVFGYYLEVTKSQLQRVPADYVRRQTLTGGERYVTPDLTRMEERIEAASVESHRIETEHFQRLRELATREVPAIQAAARVLAAIDLHLALGDCAARERWIRPTLEETKALHLVASRHPMVERSLPPGAFQPNDVALDADREQIWLITGPNMAGKSTFLRQVGLSVYLAHIGSFVPCEKATIGLADRIFTRVGASDQIARGASTFFVEMQETATILRQATDRSLVLLDEIGRGTSTYDGLSLAWAVTETLHEGPGPKPRTLFATHYHELTALESTLPRLRNRTVLVEERGHEIVFLHAIAPGRADRSYGIHVAKLAGVPEPVLHRAREILHELESGERSAVRGTRGMKLDLPINPPPSSDGDAAPAGMPPGFLAALAGELSRLSVESMTPLDALNELARLRDRAQESREH